MKKVHKYKLYLIIAFLFLITSFFAVSNIYAITLNTPSITSLGSQSGEEKALRIEFNSNNSGSNYSYELVNTNTNKKNTVAGSAKFYVYQNLEASTTYKIMLRVCTNDNNMYSCSNWTKKEASTSGSSNLSAPSITSLTSTSTSVKLNYEVYGTISGIEIYNITNNKKIKTTNKTNFTIKDLKSNTKYSFKIRAYYSNNNQMVYSSYSPIKSISTKSETNTNSSTKSKTNKQVKVSIPSISSFKETEKTIKINYKTKGTISGVEIRNVTLNKNKKTSNKKTYTWKKLVQGKKYTFKIRSYYKTGGKTYYSDWSKPKSKRTISIQKKVNSLKKYSSYKTLKTYSKSNMKKITTIKSGYNENVPQAFCSDGSHFIVQYGRHNSDSYGRLISYTKKGKRVKTGPVVSLGHANGVTCGKSLSKIYSVNRGNSKVTVLNKSSFKKSYTKSLPGGAYSIAYDDFNNRFYITGGGKIRVLNSDLKQIKSFGLKRSYIHTQDAGAYHGMILQAFTNSKKGGNYIDIYRIKDGAYLGSYKVNFGELESVIVDNGYLVVIINILGTSDDYIYKSTSKIPLP